MVQNIKTLLTANVHKILQSSIIERKFRIRCKSFTVRGHHINAGVSQENILGPVLYLIHISDIPTGNNILTYSFADDTAFLASQVESRFTSHRGMVDHLENRSE